MPSRTPPFPARAHLSRQFANPAAWFPSGWSGARAQDRAKTGRQRANEVQDAFAEYHDYVHSLPPVPLRQDEQGVIRVAASRVTLESVVALFDRGATAEEIAQTFPTLALSDVDSVLSYVIARRRDVDSYLSRRDLQERQARDASEKRSPSDDLRARLMARRAGSAG